MVQEYLNRSDDALWGLVSNGRTLRLLRDSSTLIGQSFVEFDLEAMFDGEVFSDFVVLYLTCHVSRFEPDRRDDATQTDCWLERWRTHAAETGTRALQALEPGREAGHRVPGDRVPPPPGERPAPPAGGRRRDGHATSTRPSCASSTGCCSASSPRTVACSSIPHGARARQAALRRVVQHRPPPADRHPPPRQHATPTSGRRSASCSTASAARRAAGAGAARPRRALRHRRPGRRRRVPARQRAAARRRSGT